MSPKSTNCSCRVCGKGFYRSPAQLRNGAGTYCSIACRSVGRSAELRQPETHVDLVCERCGRTFSRPRSTLWQPDRSGLGKFCSRECRKAPKDEVVKRVDAMGYVAIRINGKWTHEHRVVAEQMLGRPLEPGETVHHRNRNRTDNRPENLEVLRRPDHQRMHYKEQHPLATGEWGPGREQCAQCGTNSHPYKALGLCEKCYRRRRTLKSNPNATEGRWPDRHR